MSDSPTSKVQGDPVDAIVPEPQDTCCCGQPDGENDDCERCQLIRTIQCLPPMLSSDDSAKLIQSAKVLLTATNPLVVYEDESNLHKMRNQAQAIVDRFEKAAAERSAKAEKERNRLAC